jgi:hypothetical protein
VIRPTWPFTLRRSPTAAGESPEQTWPCLDSDASTLSMPANSTGSHQCNTPVYQPAAAASSSSKPCSSSSSNGNGFCSQQRQQQQRSGTASAAAATTQQQRVGRTLNEVSRTDEQPAPVLILRGHCGQTGHTQFHCSLRLMREEQSGAATWVRTCLSQQHSAHSYSLPPWIVDSGASATCAMTTMFTTFGQAAVRFATVLSAALQGAVCSYVLHAAHAAACALRPRPAPESDLCPP